MSGRMIKLSLAVALALALCLPAVLLANGVTEPRESKPAASQPSTTGRGPLEAAAALSVASVSAIERRGHVDNMCESQVMGQQDIKQHGGMQTFGDYKVAYIKDSPKGWYEMRNGQLAWRPPARGETAHLEVAVMDTLTGKPVPMTGMRMDVLDQRGNVVQSQPLAYYWHPMADHYGANFAIPTAGTYTLRVTAPAPDIRRHDRSLGDRFTQPLNAGFTGVRITPMAASAAELGGTIPSETTAAGPAGTTPSGIGAGAYQPSGSINVPAGQPCPPGTAPSDQ